MVGVCWECVEGVHGFVALFGVFEYFHNVFVVRIDEAGVCQLQVKGSLVHGWVVELWFVGLGVVVVVV